LNPLADVSLRLSLPAPSWMNLQLAFHLHSAALLELRLAPEARLEQHQQNKHKPHKCVMRPFENCIVRERNKSAASTLLAEQIRS